MPDKQREPRYFTVHSTYTGQGCAHCGKLVSGHGPKLECLSSEAAAPAQPVPPQLYQQISDDVAYSRKHNKGDDWLVTQIIERRIARVSSPAVAPTNDSKLFNLLKKICQNAYACSYQQNTFPGESDPCGQCANCMADETLGIGWELAAPTVAGRTQGDEDAERIKFEAHEVTAGYLVLGVIPRREEDGMYASNSRQQRWLGWRARAALRESAQPDSSELLKYRGRLIKLSFLLTGNDVAFLVEDDPQIDEALKGYAENVLEDANESARESPSDQKSVGGY